MSEEAAAAQREAIGRYIAPAESVLAYLKDIQQPTLIVQGKNDLIIPTVNSYILQQNLPNAQLIVYPDANHGSFYQYPELFISEADQFLRSALQDGDAKASAFALRQVPEANTMWSDDALLRFDDVDVSIAVATDAGLFTPVIRRADQEGLEAISAEMKELAARARANKLKPEEYQGGGFSISNLGMHGVEQFAAIINPPQSCILALGAGNKRTVVRDDRSSCARCRRRRFPSITDRSTARSARGYWPPSRSRSAWFSRKCPLYVDTSRHLGAE